MMPSISPGVAGRTPWLLLVLLVLLPAWNHPYFEELKSPNPLSRTYLTRALWDHHTVAIDDVERTHGDVMDRARRGNHTYCDKAPGSSFLLVPVYAALSAVEGSGKVGHQQLLAWGSFFLGVLPTFFALACLHALLVLLGVSRTARLLALIVMGMGSVGVPFELLFFGHQLAACLLVFTLWAGVRAAEEDSYGFAMLAGFFAGWTVITEYPVAILVLVVAAWCAGIIVRDRAQMLARLSRLVGGVLLGAAIPMALGMAYHRAAFGGPLTTGYAFIENPYFAGIHNRGLMGIQIPTAQGLFGTLLSPNRGLFYFEPWAVLWPVGAVVLMRNQRRLEGVLLLVAGLAYITFAAGFGYWLGGWSLGPRHLVPVQPLMVLGVAAAMHALEKAHSGWALGLSLLARATMVWSVLAIGLACTTHSGFPEEFIFPVFQMTLPLLHAGMFPYSLGTAWGMSREAAAWVPLTALCLSVAGVVLAGRRLELPRFRQVALAAGTVWLACAWVLGMGLMVRHTKESTHRLAWIMDTVWEPRHQSEKKRPDPVKQAPGFNSRPVAQDERNHVGRHHARTGDVHAALEEYVRGISDGQSGRR